MASHFSWYPSSDSVTIPWNARYSFPSQANKTMKMTSRIPPKNGGLFTPGQVMRLEFPAQGYVNPTHTTIEFDVSLEYIVGAATNNNEFTVRFQNNIQSIFNRVRIMYGSTPLEDIINYNVVIRNLTEWTSGNPHGCMDQSTISEGIGGITMGADANGFPGLVNVRQKYIQGYGINGIVTSETLKGKSSGVVPNGVVATGVPAGTTTTTRRYQIQLGTGLFTQEKLIPTKFMASQLAIEITLEQAQNCIYIQNAGTGTQGFAPSYWVTEVNLIPEVLEFDGSYDDMFLQGLTQGGVPIKFSSWHTFLFSSASAANVNLQIQERSRSVKALFAVQRRSQPNYYVDSGATFFDTAIDGLSTLQNYQFRVGSRFFPASPVQVSSSVGSAISGGGAEAYIELQKSLNIIGDYRLSTPLNTTRWAIQNFGGILQEFDFKYSFKTFSAFGLSDLKVTSLNSITATNDNAFSGDFGSQCFAMSTSLETSNGTEISGLNAEEQSDIALIAYWKLPQRTGKTHTINNGTEIGGDTTSALEVYTYYDAMIVLRENNVLELIQ